MSLLNNLFRLDGQVAAITGGAGRIGCTMAKAMACAGATSVIVDLNREAAEQQAARINAELAQQADCGQCVAVQADCTCRDSLDAACEQIASSCGLASVLINATQFRGQGFYGSDPAEHPLEAWNDVLDVNLTGVLLACQAFYRHMTEAGCGTIVNISSTYGVVSADPRIYGDSGVNSPVSYAASKSAVLNLSRYLAIHWRDQGIRVNCLVPGGVFDNQGDEFVEAYCQRTPLGRMAQADDYQGAALFMASRASSYMTGAVVTVDGGWTAW